MVRTRFGSDDDFKLKVNPNTQPYFGKDTKTAVMGDYPTLTDIDAAYGKNFAAEWLLPHIANLAASVGAKNLTIEQESELATIIATEYRYFKITEILLFFYRFKAGYYGKFYGSVDPMVITCALRDFKRERSNLIDQFEQEERKDKSVVKADVMNYEEWQEIKTIQAMYEMIITNRKQQ